MTDGDELGSFFEERYRSANRDAGVIPWAGLAPNRYVVEQTGVPEVDSCDAIVVGCGLGDDAEHLASLGWRVTAFDVSSSAIDWCRERFPDSPVEYVVADLFAAPPAWSQRFSLVVEVATIQSLAPEMRDRTVGAVAELVAPAGRLIVSALGRLGGEHGEGPPWPLMRDELRTFERLGLVEERFDREPSHWEGFAHFQATYRRPE